VFGRTQIFRACVWSVSVCCAGHILLGGKPLQSYNPLWLRQNLTMVSQSCSIISGTIRENLVIGSSLGLRTPDHVVHDAMRLAGCYGAQFVLVSCIVLLCCVVSDAVHSAIVNESLTVCTSIILAH